MFIIKMHLCHVLLCFCYVLCVILVFLWQLLGYEMVDMDFVYSSVILSMFYVTCPSSTIIFNIYITLPLLIHHLNFPRRKTQAALLISLFQRIIYIINIF